MSRRIQLTFASFDGALQARVGNGQDCVLLLIETPDYRAKAGIVLTPKESHALGVRLIQQAKASQRPEPQP